MNATEQGSDNSTKTKITNALRGVREKLPIYWNRARQKTIELWNSGPKGKGLCIGAAFGLLLISCWMFSGKSQDKKIAEEIAQSQADSERIMAEAQARSDAMRMKAEEELKKHELERAQRLAEQKKEEEAQRRKEAERLKQQAEAEQRQEEERLKAEIKRKKEAEEEEKAAEEKQAEEYAADADLRAREIMGGTELWGNRIEFAPEKKLSYADFTKGFYTIEDAFLPRFGELLIKFHAGQIAYPAGLSQILVNEIVPRIDHLLYYCCRTGLAPDATSKEKVNYVKLLALAQIEKSMVMAYALAFGQDSKDLLNQAENMFSTAFSTARKSLPAHEPMADAEKRYAALPYPPRPIDLNQAASDVDDNTRRYEQELFVFLPREKNDTPEQKAKTAEITAFSMKKEWSPVELDLATFPIKSFCGLKFGETRVMSERVLGEATLHSFGGNSRFYGKLEIHAYRLKKPFRTFTRAVLRFEHDGEHDINPVKQEFEALRSIQLEADIPGDVNYESCLEELAKVKKVLEEKYKLDLGKGQAGEEYQGSGKSFWYGVGLSKSGWLVLGVRSATDGNGNIRTDGRKTMVLEVRYADSDNMCDIVDAYRKKILAKREAEKESKKKKLNISENAGAEVL